MHNQHVEQLITSMCMHMCMYMCMYVIVATRNLLWTVEIAEMLKVFGISDGGRGMLEIYTTL